MTADALAIRAPTLILTDEHDMIHDLDLRLAKLRPDFKYQVFSDYSGVQMMNEPKRWAEVAARSRLNSNTERSGHRLAAARIRLTLKSKPHCR